MYILKNTIKLVLISLFLTPVHSQAAEVCSNQEIIPPFLTESVPANVLLLIDNSASMYDMAYDDIEEPGFCNDNSYIQAGTIAQDKWDSVTTYRAGAFVHVPTWNTADEAWGKKWYQTTTTISGGSEPDGSGSWRSAEWNAGSSYPIGSVAVVQNRFVQDDQSILYTYTWYKAIQAIDATANPTCNTTDPKTAPACWRSIPSLYGGYFENDLWYQWNDTDKFFIKMDPQPASSSAACTLYSSGATPAHEKYTNDDLCQVIQPQGFTYKLIDFAAKGNYLNWLVSSKLDVEKKVLTGGKYEGITPAGYLTNESRGCLGRRMIRQVPVKNGAGVAKILTMAVAEGEETSSGIGTSLPACLASCSPPDPTCVNSCNTECNTSCQDPTCSQTCIDNLATCLIPCEAMSDNPAWKKTACKDTCNNTYTTCSALCTPDATCVSNCQSNCDTTCETECENDCTNSWANAGLAKEISRIQFFPPTDNGFQFGNTACESAIEASSFGQVQNLAGDCLEIGKQNESFANSNAAFNHGFQTCWGYPTVGNGDITRMINACSNVYTTGLSPTAIEQTDSGYVCMGDSSTGSGYIGRCVDDLEFTGCTFDPCPAIMTDGQRCIDGHFYDCPTGYTWEDSLNTCIYNNDPSQQSPVVVQTNGNCKVDWVDDHDTNLDDNNLSSASSAEGCVEWAIRDYCGELYNPPVPDADKPVTSVADDHFPNLPAILVDVATNAQLGDPIKSIPARVRVDKQPEGLIQRTAGDLRIGAMTFNSQGTAWEMANSTDPNVTSRTAFYGCNPAVAPCTNRDGSLVVDYISEGGNTDALVSSINGIKATSWTPMAEALYNAIGYYTRDTRINAADFYKNGDTVNPWQNGFKYSLGSLVKNSAGDVFWAISTGTSSGTSADLENGSDTGVKWGLLLKAGDPDPDPVIAYCQSNNILVLTDGAPTADFQQQVRDFAIAKGDGDTDIVNQCGRFYGSTYADDMAFYGQQGTNIFKNEQFVPLYGPDATKENIQTYVVTTGALRTEGTENECRADVLLDQTAIAGGTDHFYPGEDFVQLEEQLTRIFLSLRTRASAGSAASVISASRGGEGAVYQAIFWPQQTTVNTATGDERSVAWVGEVHGLFVDSNGYMFEDTNGDRTMNPSEDTNGNGVCDDEDVNHNGILDSEDVNCNGVLDNEDTNGNGVLDMDDKNCNGTLDSATESIGVNGIFNTEDANCNGILDVEDDLNGDGLLTTEDTNGNCRLDREDLNNDGVCDITGMDRRVLVYFDKNANSSRGCYDIESYFTNSANPTFNGPYLCNGSVELDDVHYIWSAKNWLNRVPESETDTAATTNRPSYNSGGYQRYIFTWNDLNNDGVVNYGSGFGSIDSEVFPFEAGKDWAAMPPLSPAPVKARGPVVNDFNPAVPTNEEVDKIINWTRGVENLPGTRNRKIFNPDGTDFTWKLGDVIHSTPMTVAKPAEGYQFLYGDSSYAEFAQKYDKRRHMVYFGSNDGMLHAVNGGFYDSKNKKFCLLPLAADGTCPADETVGSPLPLGAELWAYVPYNLQPHLQCLTQEDYKHKYMVDLRPRIFDAQIFVKSDGTSIDPDRYPNGWGTILVGGMGLGGGDVDANADLTTTSPTDTRKFISAYFIFDITDPEVPPTLLGEFTQTTTGGLPDYVDLGYSNVIPTMSIMKSTNGTPYTYTDDTSKWYLVFGSGPHGPGAIKGVSDQNAKLAILPLTGLITDQYGSSGAKATRPLRITPETVAVDALDGGSIDLPLSPNGFVADPVTIDFDIAPSVADYKADAIYFGTVEGNFATHPSTGLPYWKGGGKMYRLMMRKTASFLGSTQAYGYGIEQLDTTPAEWTTSILLEPYEDLNRNGVKDANENGQPITSSASLGYDGHNFWVYFGTGRFYDADDKTDQTQQSFYGIKEPMQWLIKDPSGQSVREFLWDTVERAGTGTLASRPGNVAGSKGLLKVDEILVPLAAREADAHLLCRDITTGEIRGSLASPDLGCLPNEIKVTSGTETIAYFGHSVRPNLEDYIAGEEKVSSPAPSSNIDECVSPLYQNCVDGWVKDFWPYQDRERNLGQATLLGGLTTFTTYQPFADPCRAEGEAYLYGVYYKTGTSWYEDVFGIITKSNTKFVSDKLSLGQGLATTPNLHVGSGDQDGEGPKAFIQTSTGAIREIKQENLPVKTYRTGRSKWKEYIP